MRVVFLLLCLLPVAGVAQDRTELVGHIGSRATLLVLHGAPRPEGGWQVTGEYVMMPTLVRRYLEGERSPELGVTTLKEGTTAILFGRDPVGELRGTWRGGTFRGMRYGPGGQERERFEFSEEFPPMDGYSASVKCQSGEGRQSSALAYAVEHGKMTSFEWRSAGCTLSGLAQQQFKGGLRFASGRCGVTLRELGAEIKVQAEGCVQQCSAQDQPEPVLVDRRGACRPLRPEPR